MNSTTWHLTRAWKGKAPHFCEGFVTREEGEAALAQLAEKDALANRTGEMVNTLHSPTPYREELTPAGPQLVIPGCERQTTTKATAQLSLFA